RAKPYMVASDYQRQARSAQIAARAQEQAGISLTGNLAEELSRLAAHLDEIDRLLAAGGELGKRLDFLIQELHREANTLGSKSAALELTRISVDMKVLIEQMREQVQNIE
ncbi:MAG: endoribonuclease YicC domain-containing protein, partial [Burkholderiaceae bacterium]